VQMGGEQTRGSPSSPAKNVQEHPMTRTLLALFALASVSSAAPVPKAKPKAPFHPTAVGTKWEYIRNGDESVVYVEELTESEEKDGVVTFGIRVTPNAGNSWVSNYSLADGKFKVTHSRGVAYDSPMQLGTAGMKDGDTWTDSYTINGRAYEVESTVGKAEELTTPAGKFTATPVTRRYVQPKVNGETVWWFADGVGLVRQTSGGNPAQELKAFTPGRELWGRPPSPPPRKQPPVSHPMPRTVAALFAVAALATAAPVPKKAPPFPTAVGTKWEYILSGDEKWVSEEEVVEASEKDGVVTFKVAQTVRGGTWHRVYRLTGGELAVTTIDDRWVDPPCLLAKAGMKDGDTWEAKYTTQGGIASGVDSRSEEAVSVGKAEEVTTPAGKFTAVPVTRKMGKLTLGTFWYADGVGLIRETRDGQKHPVQELKAFTPGKK
jgi:hypothetical protein